MTCLDVPNVQFNCTAQVSLGNYLVVLNTLTLTAFTNISGFDITVKGNISSAVATTAGSSNLIISGTNPEQQVSGAGVLPNDVSINKDKGMLRMMSNMTLTGVGKNLTITKGQLNTNECQLVVSNNLTIGTSGALNKTLNSTVQVNGTLSGSITKRQRAYADGCMA